MAYVEEAKVIWYELKERFAQGNRPRIHKIKTEIGLLWQGLSMWNTTTNWRSCGMNSMTMMTYMCYSHEIRKEQGGGEDPPFSYGPHAETYRNVHSQIFNLKALLSLDKVYSMLTNNQLSRRGKKRSRVRLAWLEEQTQGKYCSGNIYVTIVGRLSTRLLWDLNGYPPNWKLRRGRKAHKRNPPKTLVHSAQAWFWQYCIHQSRRSERDWDNNNNY